MQYHGRASFRGACVHREYLLSKLHSFLALILHLGTVALTTLQSCTRQGSRPTLSAQVPGAGLPWRYCDLKTPWGPQALPFPRGCSAHIPEQSTRLKRHTGPQKCCAPVCSFVLTISTLVAMIHSKTQFSNAHSFVGAHYTSLLSIHLGHQYHFILFVSYHYFNSLMPGT